MNRAIFVTGIVVGAWLGPACAKKSQECKSWAADTTGAGWNQCADGKTREITCAPPAGPGEPQACTCRLDGVVGKTFGITDPAVLGTYVSSTELANRNCGWNISR